MTESVVPAWVFPLMITLGALTVVAILVALVAMRRTTKTKEAVRQNGIEYQGTTASAVFHTDEPPTGLETRIGSIIRNNKRFSRVKFEPQGATVYVRGNIWTWGEVIDLTFLDKEDQGTQVEARCRSKVRSSIVDYGQNGKDLALFIDLMKEKQPRPKV